MQWRIGSWFGSGCAVWTVVWSKHLFTLVNVCICSMFLKEDFWESGRVSREKELRLLGSWLCGSEQSLLLKSHGYVLIFVYLWFFSFDNNFSLLVLLKIKIESKNIHSLVMWIVMMEKWYKDENKIIIRKTECGQSRMNKCNTSVVR